MHYTVQALSIPLNSLPHHATGTKTGGEPLNLRVEFKLEEEWDGFKSTLVLSYVIGVSEVLRYSPKQQGARLGHLRCDLKIASS